MKKIGFVIGLFFIFSMIAVAQVPTEGQLWTNADFVIGLKKGKDVKGKEFDKISLILTGILRFGNNISREVDDRASAIFDFRVNKFFNITSGYLHQKSAPFRRSRNEESRFVIAGTLNKRVQNFNFRFREQYEHKFRNNRLDTNNYRTLFQVNYFLKRKNKDLFSPFIGNESYYDTFSKSWNRNEFRAGITRAFTKRFSADFYYIRLDSKTVNGNGLGIGLKFKLR
jgi:Protein of unknown function (DUF2490)